MKVIIITVLIILALLILFWNINRVEKLKKNNVEKINGKKVTRFSSNLIKQNIKKNYNFNFLLVLNKLVNERLVLVKTNNWYLDIINNKLRLVNNTNNLLVNFEESLEVSKKYNFKIMKNKDRVSVSINNETKSIDLHETDTNNDKEIVFGDKNLNGKIDLLKEVLVEGFSSGAGDSNMVFPLFG